MIISIRPIISSVIAASLFGSAHGALADQSFKDSPNVLAAQHKTFHIVGDDGVQQIAVDLSRSFPTVKQGNFRAYRLRLVGSDATNMVSEIRLEIDDGIAGCKQTTCWRIVHGDEDGEWVMARNDKVVTSDPFLNSQKQKETMNAEVGWAVWENRTYGSNLPPSPYPKNPVVLVQHPTEKTGYWIRETKDGKLTDNVLYKYPWTGKFSIRNVRLGGTYTHYKMMPKDPKTQGQVFHLKTPLGLVAEAGMHLPKNCVSEGTCGLIPDDNNFVGYTGFRLNVKPKDVKRGASDYVLGMSFNLIGPGWPALSSVEANAGFIGLATELNEELCTNTTTGWVCFPRMIGSVGSGVSARPGFIFAIKGGTGTDKRCHERAMADMPVNLGGDGAKPWQVCQIPHDWKDGVEYKLILKTTGINIWEASIENTSDGKFAVIGSITTANGVQGLWSKPSGFFGVKSPGACKDLPKLEFAISSPVAQYGNLPVVGGFAKPTAHTCAKETQASCSGSTCTLAGGN